MRLLAAPLTSSPKCQAVGLSSRPCRCALWCCTRKVSQTSVRGCWLACLHASSPRELMNMPARSDFGPYCVVRGAPAQVCACMQHPKTTYAFTCWDCQGFSHRSHTRCALVCCTQVDEYARCAPYWQHLSALRLDWTAWAFHTVN